MVWEIGCVARVATGRTAVRPYRGITTLMGYLDATDHFARLQDYFEYILQSVVMIVRRE